MNVIRTRMDHEREEAGLLAPYAQRAAETLGRRYPEEPDPYRTEFQRDRDRILHCTAFRRLEYKTQVFVNHEGDHYRTRLTHTIEAAQVGRTIANALRINVDLTEAVTLAHDFGHAPFGHAGEDALNQLMKDAGGFEHNWQSLRVVDFLERRYPDFHGLNLCYETREAIIKHNTPYDCPQKTEFSPDRSPALEAQLVNLADELAYTSHDLEDGLRAGMLKLDKLRELALWRMVEEKVCRSHGALSEEQFQHQASRHLKNYLITDTIEHTVRRLEAIKPQSVKDIHRCPEIICCLSPGMRSLLDEFRAYLFSDFYHHYRVVRMADKAQRFLAELFERYVSKPAILPDKVQQMSETEGKARAVCDYLAGMTDRFALEEYQRLFDPFARV